ncbi:MAG: AfsR/SARP family transcriptional regulator, partial [Streptosporangiaceae bacterium]
TTQSGGSHGGDVEPARSGEARPGPAGDWPVMAGTFALGMLAGGVVSSLDRLRRRQRADRPAGHRIAVPADPDGARIERRLRAAARPGGALVRDLPTLLAVGLAEFRAAVSLAGLPLPSVVGVHLLGDSLDVLLSAPAEGPPPPPFSLTPGCAQMCWSATVPSLTDPAGSRSGPGDNADLLPGLVTVGSTDEGGNLLLDLEAMPVASCAGPVEAVDRMILTVATELAAIDRGGQRRLVLVGCDGLGVLGTTELAGDLDAAIGLLAERAAMVASRLPGARPGTVRACRAADPGDQDWGLSLLISRVPPTPEQMSRLLDLTGGPGGIAALVPGDVRASDGRAAPAVFRLEPDPADTTVIGAAVTLPGLGPDRPVTVRAKTLTVTDYRALTGVLATAAGGADGPVSGTGRDTAPDPGTGYDPGTAGAVGPGAAADVLPWTRLAAAPVDPALPSLVGTSNPQVRVLGPVEIAGVATPLRPDQAELVLALAVHAPLGLTTSALGELLGPDADHPMSPDAVRLLISETGPLLGLASDGRPRILHQGSVCALHPDVGLDWAAFSALAARGMAEEAADVLWAALNLVRGEPFGGWPSWWIDIALIETIRAEIVDVAHALARLEIRAGNAAAGCRAARAGLAAESTAEQLWRALMSAEHAAGNPAGVVAAWSSCLAAIAEIDPGADPHPDTQLLFHRLSGQRVSASASLDAR